MLLVAEADCPKTLVQQVVSGAIDVKDGEQLHGRHQTWQHLYCL